MKPAEKGSPLRVAAWLALAIGFVACEYLMFRVGSRNPSALLMALFAAWVAAPFAALAWCHVAARRWSEGYRVMLGVISLLVAIVTPVVYAYVAFGPPRSQPAFFFLMLPMGSLVLVAVLVLPARRHGRS